jgi:hypothetical protein
MNAESILSSLCGGCGYIVAECQCDAEDDDGSFDADRPLTDIDVRLEDREHSDNDAGPLRIEFASFCEGEYVESVYLDLARAKEVYAALGKAIEGTQS